MTATKFRKTHKGLAAVRALGLGILALGLLAGAHARQKKITMTTSSQQAKDLLNQAVQALESFDQQKATQLAKEAVKADSNFAFAQMLVAALTRPPQPQPHIDKFTALAKNASAGEQQYLEAMSFVLNNSAEKAIPIFEKLHKDFPEERRVCQMLGQLNMNTGKIDAAIPYFEKAIKLDGSLARAYSFLGNCYLLKDNFTKARELYQTAITKISAEASPFQPFFGLTFAYLYEGKPDPALENEKEFLARYIRNGSTTGPQGFPPVWIYNNMARINLEFGRSDEALKLYEEGYKSVPGSSIDSTQKQIWYGRTLHGQARTLAKMGKHEEAWKIAEQIKQMIETGGKEGEEYWEAYHYLAGYIKFESGDYKAAAEHLEQADQNDPFHKLLLARTSLKLGDKAYALQTYQEIVKTNFSNMERALAYPEAKKMVAQLNGGTN